MTTTPKSPHYSPEREDRVAAALRENLRKRKQQAQAQTHTKNPAPTKDKL